jgi:hypothetical protein
VGAEEVVVEPPELVEVVVMLPCSVVLVPLVVVVVVPFPSPDVVSVPVPPVIVPDPSVVALVLAVDPGESPFASGLVPSFEHAAISSARTANRHS